MALWCAFLTSMLMICLRFSRLEGDFCAKNMEKKDLSPGDDTNVLKDFALETSLHGIGKVAKAQNKIRKTVWVVALTSALLLSSLMIGLRFQAYFEYNTIVELNKHFEPKMEFPAVTVCNFNKIKLSERTGTNAEALDLLNNMLSHEFVGNETSPCGECEPDDFRCETDGCCVPSSWVCDGVYDCEDSSDEMIEDCLSDYFTGSDLPPVPESDAVSICEYGSDRGITDSSGWIMSDMFGVEPYFSDLDCWVNIFHGEMQYLLAEIWTSIEHESSCSWDRLMIGHHSYCGIHDNRLAFEVSSLAIDAYIEVAFITDGSVSDIGFSIHWELSDSVPDDYTIVDTTQSGVWTGGEDYDESGYGVQTTPPPDFVYICGNGDDNSTYSEITAPSGWISSNNFNLEPYSSDLDCRVRIFHAGMQYLLAEIWTSMLYDESCSWERLMIGHHSYCGIHYDQLAFEISSLTPEEYIEVAFITDGSTGDTAFGIHWQLSVGYIPEGYVVSDPISFSGSSSMQSTTTNLDGYDLPPTPPTNTVSICENSSDNSTYSEITTPSGWITSNNFNLEPYSNDLDCRVRIFHAGMQYLLAEIWTSIEHDSSCSCDRLMIGHHRYCGIHDDRIAFEVSSLTLEAYVEVDFITDGSTAGTGFSIHWELSDSIPEGYFVSDGTPSNGSSNIISTTPNLTLNDIMADGMDHSSTQVSAATSPVELNTQERDRRKRSVTSRPHPSLHHNPAVRLVDICDPHTPIMSMGDRQKRLVLVSHRKYMKAPGEHYAPNVTCSVRFSSPDDSEVQLNFHELGLESEYPSCVYDYVAVEYNGTQYRYCGLRKVVITDRIPASTNFTVTLRTDESVENVGFALILRLTAKKYISRKLPRQNENLPNMREHKPKGIDLFHVVRARRNTDSQTSKTDVEQRASLKDTRFSQLIQETGWHLTDPLSNMSGYSNSTLLSCFFRKVKCESSWFEHTFTKFGNCYTFNALDILNKTMTSPLTLPLEQIQPGPAHGLELLIDIQRHEYSESLQSGNPQVGLKFQVHPPSETPDVENQGYAISTGQHAYVGFSLTKVKNIEPPWGYCNQSLKLKYSEQYSFFQCAIECKLDYVVNLCGCKPFYYPGPSPECDAAELQSCALPGIAKVDRGLFASLCSCPESCEYDDIDLRLSYAEFGTTASIVSEMNRKYYNLTGSEMPRDEVQFYQDNVVSLNIYFEELSYIELKQLKAMDESSLLSDLGGQLGLFIGVSVLTICEMIETMILAIYKCLNKRKLRKISQQTETPVIVIDAKLEAWD